MTNRLLTMIQMLSYRRESNQFNLQVTLSLEYSANSIIYSGVRISSGDQNGENPITNMKLPENLVPNSENLDKLKRWGMKQYRVNRQRVQEMMGTATVTTEPDLEPRVDKLQVHLTKYKELHMVRSD